MMISRASSTECSSSSKITASGSPKTVATVVETTSRNGANGRGQALQTSIFAAKTLSRWSNVRRRRLKFEVPDPSGRNREVISATVATGLFECDAVLPQIRGGLVAVPLEGNWHVSPLNVFPRRFHRSSTNCMPAPADTQANGTACRKKPKIIFRLGR